MARRTGFHAAAMRRPGIMRSAATGAITAVILFGLCWMSAFLPAGAMAHEYIRMFTRAEFFTATEFLTGLVGSSVFGGLAGGLIAAVSAALGHIWPTQNP
ncbi:hypothetical protein [Sphingosinicella rhizophila]|uniref:ABC transporter permease n=1 Tax=Sphingosinicella rhizophila TaxID=3050082 RepID=A0ABU3Q5F2_9SPHN|nr:hypothetical protein [Sphingosinicella sp. GR2756]MDT9598517.1 hypothetical protein [Sphingosinicella sp. GR2756]